ncbi:hypothetical protein GWI33_001786 [Rhynchophorus ferrugineus]|uniref:Uncharacterized protein n=1 Tax=Rhynchophorus ferrugineus TaxID=354439 RepID=A0A834MLN3_RHYFE|nr:hypothetical protein GWI33_001786 [Rhynchophorus ferrugineus]
MLIGRPKHVGGDKARGTHSNVKNLHSAYKRHPQFIIRGGGDDDTPPHVNNNASSFHRAGLATCERSASEGWSEGTADDGSLYHFHKDDFSWLFVDARPA